MFEFQDIYDSTLALRQNEPALKYKCYLEMKFRKDPIYMLMVSGILTLHQSHERPMDFLEGIKKNMASTLFPDAMDLL